MAQNSPSQSPQRGPDQSSAAATPPNPAKTSDPGCGCGAGQCGGTETQGGAQSDRVGPASGNSRGNDLPSGPRSDTRHAEGARAEAEQAGKQQAG